MNWYKNPDFWMVLGEIACGVVAFGILIIGFLLPPRGSIDPSVIQAVGEIMGFATIWMVPSAIKAGKRIRVEHGGHSLTIGGDTQVNE